MEKVTLFKVCYSHRVRLYDELVKATSAQKAVDYVRKHQPDVKIIEVSKVVYDWK